MSVDGHLIADVQRLHNVTEQSLFLVVTGSKGSGKSASLKKFVSGLQAASPSPRLVPLTSLLAPSESSAAEASTFQVSLLDYPAVALCSAQGAASAAPAPLAQPFSIVVADDVDNLWPLCSVNGILATLKRIFHLALTSPQCALVVSAASADAVPSWLTERRVPVLYPIRELTEAGMRRFLRSIPHPCFGDLGEELMSTPSLSTSRQMLLFNTCLTLESLQRGAAKDEVCRQAQRNAEFLHHRQPSNGVRDNTHPLFGLEEVRHRINTLVSVFVSHRSPATAGRLISSLAPSTGILLYGPSGCGKSALARQIASDFSSHSFFFVECTRLFSKYLGESEEQLREVYRRARRCAPAVVVLEDLDVIAQSRGAMQQPGRDTADDAGSTRTQLDVTKRMLAGLLCELDGVADNSGVLTIGITNAPHVLDAAVLRQGRLETLIHIPPLTRPGAEEMSAAFFAHFEGTAEERRQCVEVVAERTVGCAASSLKFLLRHIFERKLPQPSGIVGAGETLSLPTLAELQRILSDTSHALRPVPSMMFE